MLAALPSASASQTTFEPPHHSLLLLANLAPFGSCRLAAQRRRGGPKTVQFVLGVAPQLFCAKGCTRDQRWRGSCTTPAAGGHLLSLVEARPNLRHRSTDPAGRTKVSYVATMEPVLGSPPLPVSPVFSSSVISEYFLSRPRRDGRLKLFCWFLILWV